MDLPSNTHEQAAAMLQAQPGQEAQTPQVEQQNAAPLPTPVAPVAPAPPVEPTQAEFTNIDPATLPPELQAIYRQMQGGLTQKFQEVASLKAMADELASIGITDPEKIKGYAQLAYRLDNDPAFARQIGTRINEVYGTGTPTSQNPPAATVDPFNTDDPDPIEDRISALESMLASEKEDRLREHYAVQLANQERQITQLHPDYNDDDIAHIYEIAPSVGGDLLKANERYIAIQAHAAQKFLRGRAQGNLNPEPPNVQSVTTTQGTPVMTMRDATRAGIERMRARTDMT